MAHSKEEAMRPGGFESCTRPAPADPQAAYNAEPIVRESGTVGERQPAEYAQKMPVPMKQQGNTP